MYASDEIALMLEVAKRVGDGAGGLQAVRDHPLHLRELRSHGPNELHGPFTSSETMSAMVHPQEWKSFAAPTLKGSMHMP
ncbi:hypothetical protein BON30_21905 [Cystobacter ferrugineus]|uniref:Uncharacterized protein n=1 Tax=Cystobacter ferrugineus TaxID=83449 RepID=A0A1L9B9G7_9BACT|nr:hypothetical protein BON30_21905 [Cystobacter ferrugineus]